MNEEPTTGYEAVIADDHPDLVQSLSKTIVNAGFPFRTVHHAYNGYEALELIKNHSIHVLVTDIRMPGMDGLELVRNVRLISPKTKIVILSGYAHFEYAQRAMHYQVTNYLLKPVNEDDLASCLEQLLGAIRKESDDDRIIYAFRENLQALRDSFLNDLLEGDPPHPQTVEKKLKELHVPVRAGQPAFLLLARLEGYFLQYNQYDTSIMEFAVHNIFEETLGPDWGLLRCKDPYDYLVFVVFRRKVDRTSCEAPDSLLPELERLTRRMQEQVSEFLKGSISVVLAEEPATFPTGLRERYGRALSTLRRMSAVEQGRFLRSDAADGDIQLARLESLYEPPMLYRLFDTRSWGKALEKLESIFADAEREALSSSAHLQEVYFAATSAFSYVAHKHGKELSELVRRGGLPWMHDHQFKRLSQLREWCLSVFRIVRQELEASEEKEAPSLIERVHAFVEKNLALDLSLQLIADHVGFHPVYLSKIYKLETGNSFSAYLLNVRMEKAAELLADPKLKVYEIALQLGYQTPHYFIKVFKQHYGVTPQEYRNNLGA